MKYKNSDILLVRGLRLAVIQSQLNLGNLTVLEAKELFLLPLSPGDNTTIFDDYNQLTIPEEDAEKNHDTQ